MEIFNILSPVHAAVTISNGVRVRALPDTPLATLTQPVIDSVVLIKKHGSEDDGEAGEPEIDLIGSIQTARAEMCENDVFKKIYQDQVSAVSAIVSRNIRLTRGVILPLIDDLSIKIANAIKFAGRAATLNYDVVIDPDTALFDVIASTGLLEDHTGEDVSEFDEYNTPSLHKTTLDQTELMDVILNSANPGFNHVITEWVEEARLGPIMTDMFAKVFVSGDMHAIDPNDATGWMLALLMAWGLGRQGAPDDAEVSLEHYADIMRNFAAQCLARLSRITYNRKNNHDRVVLNIEHFNNERTAGTVIVDKAQYGLYLESGGTPESIIGYALQPSDILGSLSDLLEHKTELENVYTRRDQLQRYKNANNDIVEVRRLLHRSATHIMDSIEGEISSVEEGDFNKVILEREKIYSSVDGFLDGLNMRLLEDPYHLAQYYILDNFSPSSLVNDIIYGINKLDPKTDEALNSAAFTVVIDVVMKWLLNQTTTDINSVTIEGYHKG